MCRLSAVYEGVADRKKNVVVVVYVTVNLNEIRLPREKGQQRGARSPSVDALPHRLSNIKRGPGHLDNLIKRDR